jgi:hypothetical protein
VSRITFKKEGERERKQSKKEGHILEDIWVEKLKRRHTTCKFDDDDMHLRYGVFSFCFCVCFVNKNDWVVTSGVPTISGVCGKG